MTDNLSSLLHLLYILSVAIFVISGLCGLINRLFFNWAAKFNPQSKVFLLRLFGAFPVTGSIIVGAMISIPAMDHNSILPLDHCHVSTGCFGAPATHMVTLGEMIVIGLMLLFFIKASISALYQWSQANKLLSRIEVISEPMVSLDRCLIETESHFAFSAGMLKPRTVISTGLVNKLTAEQLQIVHHHEAIHARYNDNLAKWFLRFICLFHLPKVKQTLLKEHAAALEFRADTEVANATQSPIAVAETIIKVQSLMHPFREKYSLCQFLGSELEQRVHFLLEGKVGVPLTKKAVLLGGFCLCVIATIGAVPLHNAIEALISS